LPKDGAKTKLQNTKKPVSSAQKGVGEGEERRKRIECEKLKRGTGIGRTPGVHV